MAGHNTKDPFLLGEGTCLDYTAFMDAATAGGSSNPNETLGRTDQYAGPIGRIGIGAVAPNGEMVYPGVHLASPSTRGTEE